MGVTSRCFGASAQRLVLGKSEIDWRNAASRAYYGAYHAALAVAWYLPKATARRMGVHEGLQRRFELEGSATSKDIAHVLRAMKVVRCSADYDLLKEFSRWDADEQLRRYWTLRKSLIAFANHGRLRRRSREAKEKM